ncbi:MAG: RagB/SusD family nutrient uptake outer membrane protein [Cyclobacteriaceae bacterium]|nr:RagB/SusD family nutrient uptake outer membrane protein [Cyclobacteriaceae bacterium]
MKKNLKYLFAFALTFTLVSCGVDFLEFVPEDQATVNGWYRSEAEIRQSTASMYGRPWFGFNDVFSWAAGDLMAGDMHHNWDQEGQFFYLSYNENNSHIGDGWQGLYDVISYANLIIDDMPAIASGYGVSQAVINRGLGEARFFRGFSFFLLAEYWGDVPIIERPAEKVATGNLQLPKNTVASVYEFARRDLVFAAENLPATDAAGRVTAWAAKGMLAKLHVTLGQRSVGGGTIGSAADFTIAANYAADVINNSGLTLYSNYEDMFKIANEHNREILFGLQFINGGWGFGNSRQARFARHSVITGDAQAWGGGKCMSISFLNTLAANAEGKTDLRRRAIYMQNGDIYSYLATKSGGYKYNIVSRDAEGTQIEGATPTLNSLKKYVVGNVDDHGYVISNQDSPMDIYMLRLSDVYLLYAEALLGSNSSLTSGPGYDAYLAVRARAGLNPPADGSMTYVDLFNERRVEFALEGIAWLDVKRRYYRNSSEALAYLNSQGRTDRFFRINANDNLENDAAGYEVVAAGGIGSGGAVNTDPVVAFTATKMTLPIPGIEVVNNPLLRAETPAVEYDFN